jgi:hypothetical protein
MQRQWLAVCLQLVVCLRPSEAVPQWQQLGACLRPSEAVPQRQQQVGACLRPSEAVPQRQQQLGACLRPSEVVPQQLGACLRPSEGSALGLLPSAALQRLHALALAGLSAHGKGGCREGMSMARSSGSRHSCGSMHARSQELKMCSPLCVWKRGLRCRLQVAEGCRRWTWSSGQK